jgi:hypothetical protein
VREEFERQVKSLRLWSRVTPVQAFSNDAAADWDGPPVGLLYIDGDHSAAAIRTDLAAWAPHLAERHVVAFDDLDTPKNPGVRVVVEEMMAAGYMLTVMADRLAVCRP